MRSAISDVLTSEGHVVSEAADGIEGLRSAREGPPDLILLDLMMPKMDGWEFRDVQRADPDLSRVPVVIVSASLPEDVHALGAVGHLHKPFELSALLEAVERHASPS